MQPIRHTPRRFIGVVNLNNLFEDNSVKKEDIPPHAFFTELKCIGLYPNESKEIQIGTIITYEVKGTAVYITGHIIDDGIKKYELGYNEIGLMYEIITRNGTVTFENLTFLLCKNSKLQSRIKIFN